MIEIKCADPKKVDELCATHGVCADVVLVMTDRDETVGYACIKTAGETVELLAANAPDTSLLDALLRAALNAVRARGAVNAVVRAENLLSHMQNRGYLPHGENVLENISEFFANSHCKA